MKSKLQIGLQIILLCRYKNRPRVGVFGIGNLICLLKKLKAVIGGGAKERFINLDRAQKDRLVQLMLLDTRKRSRVLVCCLL